MERQVVCRSCDCWGARRSWPGIGLVLKGWLCAESEGALAATVLRVGLIRGPRWRKGSMQGGRYQHLRMGYRQTGLHPRNDSPGSLYPAVGFCRQGAPSWWLRAGGGAVSGRVGLRVLTGHGSLASRLYKMGITSKTTASFCFLVSMYRLYVL